MNDSLPHTAPAPSRGLSLAFRVGVFVAVLAVIAMALSGLGSRWGWWNFRTGFSLLRWSAYAAMGGALLALLAAAGRRSGRTRSIAIAGVLTVVAFAAVAVPWQYRRTARTVPPIHDITTDTDNPPAFVALHDQRPGASNPVEYGGPEVAAKQRAGYPDIQPLELAVPPAQAVARAAAVALELGWTIAAVDTAAGRVEATDRTRWFGFYDDVVVRVTPTETGSLVDVRSLSRVGGSDVGTNARRIRTFLDRLQRGT